MGENEISLLEAQPGDIAHRLLAESVPMELRITKIHEGLIFCGPWTFDQETGIEEDSDLNWGRAFGVTGSRITKVVRP